jgi:DNA-directed RNA polymerase specialized sigma24 family protein
VIDRLRSAQHRLCQPLPEELDLLLADPEPLPEELALLHEEQQAVQELLDGLSAC